MEATFFSINTSDQLIYALGWTVLHSLWQGTLLALLVGVLAAFIKKQSAQTRYWTALAGLGGLLLWAAFTFVRIYQMPVSEIITANGLVLDGQNQFLVNVAAAEESGIWAAFLSYFEEHLPMIVSCWLIGMSVFALRFLGGLAYIQQLKYQYNRPVDTKFQLLLDQLRQKMQLTKAIALVESTKIRVPMTIGHLKPIVLLPAGALLALSPAQIEAVLAHELAHIKRNDFLINLFQSVVEVLFYYHPAVWWLSTQVRLERENCCDDIAVVACGDDLEYAKALLSLQEYSKTSPTFAMAFSNKKNHLLNRVKRILNHPINSNRIMEKFSITALILLCLLVVSMRDGHEVYEPLVPEEVETVFSIDVSETDAGNSIIEVQSIQVDTIPKGKVNLKLTRNGEKIEAKMENGEIKSLKVNGAVQDKSTYEAYLPILEEVMNVPPPPAPPAPPAPSLPSVPPAPSAPPAPPAPVSSNIIQVQKSVRVKTEEGSDGHTIVIVERENGGEPMEIKISEVKGDEKIIFLNGERMENGASMIFVDEVVVEEMSGQHIGLTDLELMHYQGQNLESVRGQLATVRIAKSEGQVAELAKLKAELARVSELSEVENQQRLVEMKKRLEAAEQELNTKVLLIEEQKQKELKTKRVAMDQQMLELEKISLEQKVEAEKLKGLAEKQKANQEKMINEMINDGLLESTDNYNIMISNTSLKVNGKKQSQAVFEKYKKIYEAGVGGRSGKYKITLKKSNN